LRLVLLKDIPEDADLRRQWNALALSAEQPQVFYTYEWALAACRSYQATLKPVLFLGYDPGNDLCAVAALATDPSGQRVSFLCATTADYCDFLSAAEHREEFVVSVLAELKKQNIGEMVFANLPADSGTATVLRNLSGSIAYRVFARTGYVCAQVSLSALERRGDAKPVLPRKKMLRRFLNAMGREAPVRLDHARSWDAVEAILPEFVQAHVARFLVTGRVSNAARPERREFLAELAKLLSESGWVVLTRMMSGTKVFAWNYGFQFQGTWFWYQPTFVNDLEKYSPGFCLLAKLIEEAAENPAVKTVDLGLGAEEYKDRFANQAREILYVTVNASVARHYREIFRYHAAEIVRTSPRVESAARGARQAWRRLRERLAKDGAAATSSWAARRLRELLWLEHEVFFYEWRGSSPQGASGSKLRPLDLSALADATSQCIDDETTLRYLLRAATRVQEGKAEGFGLVDADGKFLHFAWATTFDGFFLSELQAKVRSPSADSVMLFDCWTPAAALGKGYYAQTVELIAEQVQEKGGRPWIFSAAVNAASIRGLEKTGFQRRYSLVRQRLLGWDRVKGQTPKSIVAPSNNIATGAEDSAA
jgi:CelD/BcsL family acetyltransferase involved in cellulose biosynthesis